jgi:hypothetical protein
VYVRGWSRWSKEEMLVSKALPLKYKKATILLPTKPFCCTKYTYGKRKTLHELKTIIKILV